MYTKWKKGREANENILMEEKPHSMRKVRVMQEQKFKRTNLHSLWGIKKKKAAGGKKSNSFAFPLEMDRS